MDVSIFCAPKIGSSNPWGALNAVTYVEDHLRESNDEGNNLHSAWFGAGANRKARALDLAVKYAEAA